MAIRNRLLDIVKECRQALKQEAQRTFADEQTAAQVARVYFLELAILRSLEIAGQCPSLPWQEIDLATFHAHASHVFKIGEIFHEDNAANAFIPSTATNNLLCHHFTKTISPEQWSEGHLLGWLYQYFEEQTEQRRQGRFYTPESVAALIVARTFALLPECHSATSLRLLDLASGAGIFALQAFDRLYDLWLSHPENVRPPSIAAHILDQQLFLIDHDPFACELARVNLFLQAKRREPTCDIERMNVFCADALIRWENVPSSSYSNLFTQRYDAVVGNPPYIVINRLRTPSERLALYDTYRTAAYKPNTFALFLERGLDLLTPKGALGMVVPNTLLTQLYFEPLRTYILERAAITHILDTKRLFPKAFVENCILLLQRQDDPVIRQRQMIECRFAPSLEILKTFRRTQRSVKTPTKETSIRIPQRRFETAPFHRFSVSIDMPTFELLERIETGCPKLGDICECHDGINPGNAKQKLIVTDALDERCQKVLNGKNIGRYRINWGGLFVRYDRSLAAKGDVIRWGHLPSLNAPKILTRQTADRIIAAFDDGQYYATNSLHTTILQSATADFHLKYLLGLLNSTLLSFYYRKFVFETGQVFSQVKLMNLRQLPIKAAPPQQQRDIIALVEQLLDAHGRQNYAERPHPADTQLDARIYALYHLSNNDVRMIEQSMGRFRSF